MPQQFPSGDSQWMTTEPLSPLTTRESNLLTPIFRVCGFCKKQYISLYFPEPSSSSSSSSSLHPHHRAHNTMGGDASKIAKEAGVSEAEVKSQGENFKRIAHGHKSITRKQYTASRSADANAGNSFDAFCRDDKMTFREYVLANTAGRTTGSRPSTTSTTTGGGGGGKKSGARPAATTDEDREKRAAAAEARLAAASKRGTGVKQEASMSEEEKRIYNQKQDLIGKIRANLQALKQDEPFGLASMTPEKLQNYLSHLQQKQRQ